MGFILRHIKLIIWAIIGIIVISIVVFMTTSIDSELERITDAYLSLTGNTNVEGKKDNFYSAYIEQQEENQEAIANGDSAAGTTTVTGSGSSSHSYTGNATAYGYATEAEAKAALAAIPDIASGAISSDYWRVEESNGRYYVVEVQKSGPWSYVGKASKMSAEGCMWYAMSALLSAKTGEVWTIRDLLEGVGTTISVSNGYYSVNPQLEFVGKSSGSLYSGASISADPQQIVSLVSGYTLQSSTNTIDTSELDAGGLYLYYATNAAGTLASSGGKGMHWQVIVGYDDDYYYFIASSSTVRGQANRYDRNYVDSHLKYAYLLKGE